MFDFIKDFLSGNTNHSSQDYAMSGLETEKKLQIATCALFLEVANSDENFTETERKKIFKIMKELFYLSDEFIKELIEISQEQMRKSVSLYEFTDVINRHYSKEDKYNIVKNLWRLIYVDNELHKFEEHFVRMISNNLHLAHNDFIAAKMEAKEEIKSN